MPPTAPHGAPATMRWITLTFGLSVAGIVVAANLGIARPLFVAVGRVPAGDKICHFLLVGVLCFLVGTTLAGIWAKSGNRVILTVIATFVVLVTVDEFSQIWLAHRSFDLWDLACNYAGILVFGLLTIWWESRRHNE